MNALHNDVVQLALQVTRELYPLPELTLGPVGVEELRQGVWRCTVAVHRDALQRVVIFQDADALHVAWPCPELPITPVQDGWPISTRTEMSSSTSGQ